MVCRHLESVKIKLKTQGQNDCYQAAYISYRFCHTLFIELFTRICISQSTASALKLILWHLDTLLSRNVLIGKINTLVWFCCMKKSVMEDKKTVRRRGCSLLHLGSRLATVVRQLVSETKFQISAIFKNSISATNKCFHIFNAVFHVGWTNIIALN